jgi:SAM-dependent methyltransferase
VHPRRERSASVAFVALIGSPPPPCPVCSGVASPLRAYGDRGVDLFAGRRIDRCDACGLGFATPMPSEQDLAAYYESSSYELTHGARGHHRSPWALGVARARSQVELVTRWSGAPASWLDVGAGYGFLLDEARRLGAHRTVGVELTPERVAELTVRGHGVVASVDEAEGPFAVVSMSHMLEHVPDPCSTLAAVNKKLAPQGTLLCEVPNKPDLDQPAADTPHVLFFVAEALTTAMRAAGLEPVAVRTCGIQVRRSSLRNKVRGRLGGVASRRWPAAPRVVVRQLHATSTYGPGRIYLRVVARPA